MKHQWRHANSIRRAFAGEAVALHPYHNPPGLHRATEGLVKYLEPDASEMIRIRSWAIFRKRIYNFCHQHAQVAVWNIPEKGEHRHVFVTRYNKLPPEYDFIDLSALANNTIRAVMRDDY